MRSGLSHMISRPFYLNQLIAFGNEKNRKLLVLSGVRGSGKTILFSLYRQYLESRGIPEEAIISYDLENTREFSSSSSPSFFDAVKDRIKDKNPVFLFLDEISVLSDWEKAIAAFTFYPVKILIATSHRLSDDFHSLFNGQYIDLPVFPLSFPEYHTTLHNSFSSNMADIIPAYFLYGGFPQFVLQQSLFDVPIGQDISQSLLHLRQIYSVSVMLDILERPDPMDYHTLHAILLFLAEHLGELHSPNSIARELSAHEETRVIGKPGSKTVAMRTVEKYMNLLQDSFLIYRVPRYDIRTRTMLKTLDKHYFVDPGVITALTGNRLPGMQSALSSAFSALSGVSELSGSSDSSDLNSFEFDSLNLDNPALKYLDTILENLVFLELVRRGYNISTGKIGDRLVDFIAQKGSEKSYIQVTPSMKAPLVRVQELLPLRMIPDNYEKIILTLEPEPDANYDGIRAINLITWMLSGQ